VDILKFILEYAAKEWAVIRQAPAAAFILFVSASLLAYGALSWRYAGQIESLTGQNSLLKDQVEDYRERLGLVSADKTAYSRLTNQELRKAVFEYQTKLEEFAERA